MEPTESEETGREKVYHQLTRILGDKMSNLRAQKFGSQTTGLAVATSDIDVRLYHQDYDHKHPQPDDPAYEKVQKTLQMSLTRLAGYLRKHKDYTLVVLHPGRFPLVGAHHKPSDLSVQVVAAGPVHRSRRIVKEYIQQYPHLKTIYTVLKTAFDMRGFSDVYNGGLGSYSILMMRVAYLNQHHDYVNVKTPAEQLLGILDFYGNELNTYCYGIDGSTGLLFAKHSGSGNDKWIKHRLEAAAMPEDEKLEAETTEQEPINEQATTEDALVEEPSQEPPTQETSAKETKLAVEEKKKLAAAKKQAIEEKTIAGRNRIAQKVKYQHYLLCLQDPADPYNDLGRKSFAWKHIQATLSSLHADLSAAVEGKLPKGGPRRNRNQPILRMLVGRCDQTYDDRRARLELYGDGFVQGIDEAQGQGQIEDPIPEGERMISFMQ